MTQAPEQYQVIEVVEHKTELRVPHLGKKLTFLHPAYGPDTYANVGLAIQQDNLRRPTMAETASLVHASFNSDDRYSKEIEGIVRHNELLWAFNGTLYIPKEGAFIQDNPEIRDEMIFMNLDDLVQRLNVKDPNVRFVPFGYKVGEMVPSELAKNPYVIGLVGEEVAEKLARIAEKFGHNPYLQSFESTDKNETRVSALGSLGLDYRYLVLGYFYGGRGYGNGHAFGILK